MRVLKFVFNAESHWMDGRKGTVRPTYFREMLKTEQRRVVAIVRRVTKETGLNDEALAAELNGRYDVVRLNGRFRVLDC